MPKRPKYRMTNEERAKQFLPFAALSGLEVALKEQEIQLEYEEMKILSEEEFEKLNKIFLKLEIGTDISILFWENHKYHSIKGPIQKIIKQQKTIIINFEEIPFENIISISILSDRH